MMTNNNPKCTGETKLLNRQKYRIELPGADNALEACCVKAAAALYGNPVPSPVLDRMTAELNAIQANQYASHYLIASELAQYSVAKGYPVTNRGMLPSSLVTYLSGISDVNPLPAHYRCPKCHCAEFIKKEDHYRLCGYDLPDRQCPHCGALMIADGADILSEVNMGLELGREPDITLNFAPEIRFEIIAFIKERLSKEQVFRAGVCVETSDGSIRKSVHPGGIYIVPADVDISEITALRECEPDDEFQLKISEADYNTIDDKLKKYDILTQQELGMLHDLELKTGYAHRDISLNDRSVLQVFSDDANSFMTQFPEIFRKVIRMSDPQCFSDLARVEGLLYGAGTWTDNGESLLETGISIKDIISCRDDVFQFLMHKGIRKEESYRAMRRIRAGKGLTQDLILLMESVGIPEWYMDSCNKIQYLYPWSQCVEYTTVKWKLAYYWLHYLDAYGK